MDPYGLGFFITMVGAFIMLFVVLAILDEKNIANKHVRNRGYYNAFNAAKWCKHCGLALETRVHANKSYDERTGEVVHEWYKVRKSCPKWIGWHDFHTNMAPTPYE